MAEAHVLSNLLVALLLAAGVAVGFFVRRNRLWREAVVDLRRRLGLEPAELGRASRIVVLHGDDGRAAGLLVDAVREVARAPEASIGPPVGGESGVVGALYANEGEFVSIIDLDRVLDIDAGR